MTFDASHASNVRCIKDHVSHVALSRQRCACTAHQVLALCCTVHRQCIHCKAVDVRHRLRATPHLNASAPKIDRGPCVQTFSEIAQQLKLSTTVLSHASLHFYRPTPFTCGWNFWPND